MTKSELGNYKQSLEAKQAENVAGLHTREAITIEKSADPLDEVQNAGERELSIRNLDRESNLARNIAAALHRIDEGTFGTCLQCEEDISPKRLNALPWAPLCIRCQEIAESSRNEADDSFDNLLATAA